MESLHSPPIPRIQVRVMVSEVLFPEDMFLNVPPMPSHTVAPGHDGAFRKGASGDPRPGAVMLAFGIGPGFLADGIMHHSATEPASLGIMPFVVQLVDPPKVLGAIAPDMVVDILRLQPMLPLRVGLEGFEIARFEHQHKIPPISPQESK